MSDPVIPISASPGVAQDIRDALIDVEAHCREFGNAVLFRTRTEAQVVRDRYGTIKNDTVSTDYTVYCFPIDYNPNVRRIREAGLFEEVEVIAWSPMQTWLTASLSFEKLDATRMTVVLNGSTYSVRAKGLASMLGSQYLYITWGLWRK